MISRETIFAFAKETYGAEPDYPWPKYPTYAVLRHPQSRKWFGVVMQIAASSLRLDSSEKIDVINLKCDPFLLSELQREPGIYPAYHMSKEHWFTLRLDAPIAAEKIFALIDLSHQLTS